MGIHEAELCIASVPRVNSERSVLPDSASELVSLGFIKNCTWVTAGLGPRSWRAWISRASAQLPAQWRWALPSTPGFLCKAHSADHHCCLCRPSPPTNPYRACCLKAKSPWANICYLKLYFIFLSRCFFFSPLSRMISLCIGKAWTSDLWSTQSNKASRQQSGTSSNILR